MSQTYPTNGATARLSLPLMQEAQAQKHVTHNEALVALDAVVQIGVAGVADAPPADPADAERWIVGPAPTGAWAGQAGAVAAREGFGAGGWWAFHAPRVGWTAWDAGAGALLAWDGAAWVSVAPDRVARLGVGTDADAVNRLAVAAPATLLSHAGDDHRVVVNKAAPGDTASLLFQSGWSGRAEMGLAGGDGFAVRVSPDGSAWTTALEIDPASATLGGAAVQQAPDDATPGRLMRADWGYGRGNVVGPVSQSGGVPTGAVIESGATPDGDYVRWADGTQICTAVLTLTHQAGSSLAHTWSFPRPFLGAPDSVSASLNANSALANAAPTLDEFGATMHANTNAVQAKVIQYRVAGATDFDPGDTAMVRVQAVGRWV